MTPINPQEIFLLERYSSPEYFAELRDTWGKMVSHVETCLANFMRNLPTDYRSRALPEQPDIVWGERVLPNFRDTFQGLCTGFIMLSHGDPAGLHFAHGPRSDFKGQLEYWSGWMPESDEQAYGSMLNKAVTMASNICATEGAYWPPFALSKTVEQRGQLEPSEQWPLYKVNNNISVVTGQKTPRSGIYVPDVDESCAEFLSIKYNEAPAAIVFVGSVDLTHPTTGEKYAEEPRFETRDCVWYLVERDHWLDRSPSPDTSRAFEVHRVRAGGTCPATGFYLTPARPESRKLFREGEIMPEFQTSYGTTIWQWDINQS